MKARHIIIYVVLTLLLALFAGGAFHYWSKSCDQASLLSASRVELQAAKLSIGRGETLLADANKRADTLSSEVKKDVEARRAALTLVAELRAKLETAEKEVQVITRLVYRDRVKRVEVDLPPGKIFVERDGKYYPVDNMAYSYRDHRITITGDAIKGVLSYKLHQKFRGVVAESKRPDGGYNHYATLWELGAKGEDETKLKLTSFKVVKTDELAPRMWWWAPHVDLLGGAAITSQNGDIGVHTQVELGVSFMGYGKTNNDLSWRFIRVGVGVTGDEFSLSLSPAMYNVGGPLPLVSNLWITPTVDYIPLSGGWGGGLGLSVVF
tara:strand:+ start:1085 stop:2053 length:969 start_codon:yes stop_codon:yes gene_type:complete